MSSSSSESDNADTSDPLRSNEKTSARRRGRGPSILNSQNIEWARSVGVEWNEEGQPIGKASDMLSTAIGALAKNLSIIYRDWMGVPMEEKLRNWETLKVRIIVIVICYYSVYANANYLEKILVGKIWPR